jgi:hypothetical protein
MMTHHHQTKPEIHTFHGTERNSVRTNGLAAEEEDLFVLIAQVGPDTPYLSPSIVGEWA